MKYNKIEMQQYEPYSIVPEGYRTSYNFDIDIFNLELYRKLAIDYNRHNLLKVVPIPLLKKLLGKFTYFDDGIYKYGMVGSLALKTKENDFFEKCKALEEAILNGMEKLGYYNEVDFEINRISWNEFDANLSVTNVCDYIAADTTYNIYHPKFKELHDAELNRCLFKYSDPIYYEDDPDDAKKIINLLRTNKLKQNYVNSDLLPILKTEYQNTNNLCCQLEKSGIKISVFNNADSNTLAKVLSAFK